MIRAFHLQAISLIVFLSAAGAGAAGADDLDSECLRLIRADYEIQRYDADLEIYKFLHRQDTAFSAFEEAKRLKEIGAELNELRASPEGLMYRQSCVGLLEELDQLVFPEVERECSAYYVKDQKLYLEYEDIRKKLEKRIDAAIAQNEDFVGLGERGKPLAANVTEFNKALSDYKERVKSREIRVESLRAWRDAMLAADPTLYTRCVPENR